MATEILTVLLCPRKAFPALVLMPLIVWRDLILPPARQGFLTLQRVIP